MISWVVNSICLTVLFKTYSCMLIESARLVCMLESVARSISVFHLIVTNLYSWVVKVASHNHVKWIPGKSIMLIIVTIALSILIVFMERNDLWLYLYYAHHIGNVWRIIWIADALSIQFNELRKTWGLMSCCSWLIWGVEFHNLLKEQLEIVLYASMPCVEKSPLANPSIHWFLLKLYYCLQSAFN